MRFPPNWSMELLLSVALFIAVIMVIFAAYDAPGDRTRFTLERSDATHIVRELRTTPMVEETALGR